MGLVLGHTVMLPLLPRGGSCLRLTALAVDGKPKPIKYLNKAPNSEYDRDELGEEDDSRLSSVSAKDSVVLTLAFQKPLPPDTSRGLVVYGRGTGKLLPEGARWLGDAERGIRPWVWHFPELVSGPDPVTVTLPRMSMRLSLLCGLLI